MIILLVFLLSFFVPWGVAATWFAWKWAHVILILEDDLSEAIDIHERSVSTLDRILTMPMFSDSPDVRPVIAEALEDIKVCKFATQKIIDNFTARSKQKYVRAVEDNN